MAQNTSPAIAVSQVFLVVLLILNAIVGVGLIVFLPATFVFEPQFVAFFSKRPPSIDATWLMPILRVWIVLAMPMIAAVHGSLRRLLDVVATVGAGDPFVPENAKRLKTIAWCMFVVQLLHLVFGGMAKAMDAAGSNIPWQFSLNGWLAVVLVFVLAHVFEAGTRMRDDLEQMI